MTVKELKEMLNEYPDNMQVVNRRYSDYQIVSINEWFIIKGVEKDGWVMASHRSMSDDNKRNEKEYLYLEGN